VELTAFAASSKYAGLPEAGRLRFHVHESGPSVAQIQSAVKKICSFFELPTMPRRCSGLHKVTRAATLEK
jgi:hypothetical protein